MIIEQDFEPEDRNNKLFQILQAIDRKLDQVLGTKLEQEEEPYLTTDQVVEKYPFSKGNLYRLCSEKQIEYIRVGKRSLFKPSWIQAYLDKLNITKLNDVLRKKKRR